MSWLYLALMVVEWAFTLNAHFPQRSRPRLSVLSFFFGWLTSELALHHIVFQLLATLLFIKLGALAAWPGYVGLGVAAVNWTMLFRDYVSGWAARDVLDTALTEALGVGWRERVRPDLLAAIQRVALRQLVFPIPVRHPGAVKSQDVVFYEEPAFKLRLDVYRRRSKPGVHTPTLIYVHGGAWVIGDKSNQGLPILQHLAALGWTCFGINYRLSPRATYPDHLIDVKRAIAWVRAHGHEYGANPDFIIICGGSAGGHLAALAALTPHEKSLQPGFEDVDCSVSGCVPLYGVFDFTNRAKIWPHLGMVKLVARRVLKVRIDKSPEVWEKASPLSWVSQEAPPFLIVHGARDSLVPPAESRNFAAALRAKTASPVALAIIPGGQHAFEIFPSPRAVCTAEAIAEFSIALYSRYLDRTEQALRPPLPTERLPELPASRV
jgi:acetyl esterase/lipase